MPQFSGTAAPINRFLGYLDADDATNTPVGLASLARNCAFDLTSARTRDGYNMTMIGINRSPITGLLGIVYQPETATDTFFQLPLLFDLAGSLQYESPVGGGKMTAVPTGLFSPPANSHMISVQTYNKAWLAFSNLSYPTSQMACLDPKTLNLDPYGMKPFGWNWLPSTAILVGEVATPTAPSGNGHTYRCTVAGTTGAVEPAWPTLENGTVVDGTATWEEYTAVMANRLPAPVQPVVTRDSGAGTFAAGRDVYIIITFQNSMGETIPSVSGLLSDTVANDAASVAIPTLASLPGWVRGLTTYAITGARVYEADVATGSPAPPQTSYELVGSFALGSNAVVTATSTSGTYPPTINSARITPGQLPTPDIAPVPDRITSGGAFPAGRDVYVLQTYVNASGETPAGTTAMIADTQAGDGVQVTVAAVPEYPQILTFGIYEADVPTGNAAPASTEFALVGYYAPGATPTITASATGPAPPIVNGTGPAGNIAADTATGGINATQGYRYAAIMFENRNYSVSGFTPQSVIQYDVDEDGWELSVFNVATGPANIIARLVAFTVADGTSAGDFWWLGNIDPQVPTTNFVYPQTLLDDGIVQSATCFYDNVTTSGTFNFTDEYLDSGNLVTDRLDIIWPAPCVHIAYHPSIDRMIQTGLYPNMNGCRISLAAAAEDYYGDTCDVTIGGNERAWGTLSYRAQVWLLRERSGFVISSNTSNPNEWAANERFSHAGACGPRAFDSCDAFFIFVHRSGVYRYEDTQPENISKEIPYLWQTINWLAATTIWVYIDRENHEVHVGVPVNGSTVPNQELVWNYNEGWNDPIHFSTYSGREISMDACRKISVNDCSAFVCTRLERALPPPVDPIAGSDNVPLLSSSFYISQVVFGSSGSDGYVNAKTPGIFSDNGMGIDWRYRTVCPEQTMALSRIEGFELNARGNGVCFYQFIAGRNNPNGQQQSGRRLYEIRPFTLEIDQSQGIDRRYPPYINERWSMEFSNGKTPGVWASLKWLAIYTIPMYSGRSASSAGGAGR